MTKKKVTMGLAFAAIAAFAAPERGVPKGCDGSVMSDAYWRIWNKDVQEKLDAEIEKNRKADGVFAVDAKDGSEVSVELVDHAFRFGAHIFNFNQLGKTEWNEAYKASYGADGIFNQATVAFYWNAYEPVPKRLRAGGDYEDTERFWNSLTRDEAMAHPFWRRPAPGPVINFLKGMDVRIHGHILIWGSARPYWIYDRYCPESEKRVLDLVGIPRRSSKDIPQTDNWSGGYNLLWGARWREAYNTATEADIVAMAPIFCENMRKLFRKRVFDVAGEFGDVVDSWDVVNESSHDWKAYRKSRTGLKVWKSVYGIMPGDYPLHALLDAKEAFSGDAKLAINDYNICEDFLSQVKDLDGEGAKIDIVGCQMHLFNTNDCMRLAKGATNVSWVGSPKTIFDRLDLMAKTGRPLHVSEITITSPGPGDRARQIQAILTRNIYRAWFAHPALMGITWWNTVDGGGVKGEPLVSGLFTSDMKKKPAYLALDELINRDWKTKAVVKVEGGKIAFRGFRGRYRFSWVDSEGVKRVTFADLSGTGTVMEKPFTFKNKLSFIRAFKVDGKPIGLSLDETRVDLAKIYPDGVGSPLGNATTGSRWADLETVIKSDKAKRIRLWRQNEYFGELTVNGKLIERQFNGPYDSWAFEWIDLQAGENVLKLRTRAGTSGEWFCGLALDAE